MLGVEKGGLHYICKACKKPMVRRDAKTGEMIPSVSSYKICLTCLLKAWRDPEYWKWTKTSKHAA